MIKGVRLSQEQIADRFGTSRRIAVRVCALQARDVMVSEAFLESVKSDPTAERLLLDQRILAEASDLTPERFAEIAADYHRESDPTVLAASADGVKIIALEEELLADQASVPMRKDNDLSLFSSDSAALQAINDNELSVLFPPEEVGRLKLLVLTSADPTAKIQAIRQLMMCPLNPTDKGLILIQALRDSDRGVQVEVAEALTALGLDPGIAEASRDLNEGNVRQRILAAQRLGTLSASVSHSQISVILTLLASTIGGEESVEVKGELIRSFKGACAVVAQSRASSAELLHLLVRQLEIDEGRLYRAVREIVAEIGKIAPEQTTSLLLAELDKVMMADFRRVVLGLFASFSVPEEHRNYLAQQGVAAFNGCDTPEHECRAIGGMLCQWGNVAIDALLTGMDAAEDAARIYIIHLLDEIVCRRGGQDKADRVVGALLVLLRTADKHVRTPVLETGALTHPSLSDSTKSAVAKEIMAAATEFANPRMLDIIETSLALLGTPAISELQEFLKEERENHAARAIACKAITTIVERVAPNRRQLADDVLVFLQNEWSKADFLSGYLAEATGKVAAFSSKSGSDLEAIARKLMEDLQHSPQPGPVLRGLGAIAASPNMTLDMRLDVARLHFDLLDGQLPDITERVTDSPTNDDDQIHFVGSEVSAYTEIVPTCITGLRLLYFSSSAAHLRKQIIGFLIKKWTEVATWETIWSPAAIKEIIASLGQIACGSDGETAGRIANALMLRLDLAPVIAQVKVISENWLDSTILGGSLCEIGSQLIGRISKYDDIEHKDALLAVSSIAARTNLGKDPARARILREKTAKMLFAGLRNGVDKSLDGLRLLATCAALPPDTRREIEMRMQSPH